MHIYIYIYIVSYIIYVFLVNPSACSKKTSAWPARAARAAAVHRASGPSPGGPLDFHWDHRFLSLWDVHLDFHWIFTGFSLDFHGNLDLL